MFMIQPLTNGENQRTAFEITSSELAKADDYEVDDYQRIEVTLKSEKKVESISANNLTGND